MPFTRIDTGSGATSRDRFVNVLLSGTVTAKDVLMLDASATGHGRWYTAKRAATNALGQPLSAGVAAVDGVSGDVIAMQVEGIASAKSASLVQDDVCVVDATAASLEDAVPADHNCPGFAVAMGTTSGGFTDVLLLNPLKL